MVDSIINWIKSLIRTTIHVIIEFTKVIIIVVVALTIMISGGNALHIMERVSKGYELRACENPSNIEKLNVLRVPACKLGVKMRWLYKREGEKK